MSGFNEAIDYSPSDGKPFLRTGSASGSGTQQIVGNVAHDAVDSGNSVKVGGYAVDLASPRTAVAVGDRVDLALTQNGHVPTYPAVLSAGEFLTEGTNGVLGTVKVPVSTSTFAKSYDISAAAEASSVIKASAGNLYDVHATNSSGSARYFQLFKSATVPADTTVPNISIYVAAGGSIHEAWPEGKYSSVGWAWAWSSTAATKTIGGSDGIAEVEYL